MHVDLFLCQIILFLSIYLGSNLEITVTYSNHMLRRWGFFSPFKQHQSLTMTSLEVLQVLISETQHTQKTTAVLLLKSLTIRSRCIFK